MLNEGRGRVHRSFLQMPSFVKKTRLKESADKVYAWHLEAGAFEELNPPWEPVEVVSRPDVLNEGALVELKMKLGPFPLRWSALHQKFEPGRRFDDISVRGPFKSWHHQHLFVPREVGMEMIDSIEFELFGGALVNRMLSWIVKGRLEKMFAYRHARLEERFGRLLTEG